VCAPGVPRLSACPRKPGARERSWMAAPSLPSASTAAAVELSVTPEGIATTSHVANAGSSALGHSSSVPPPPREGANDAAAVYRT